MRLTAAAIGRELHLSPARTRRLLHTYSWLAQPKGTPPTYRDDFLDLLAAVRGRPIRSLEPVHRDWLTHYLGDPMSMPGSVPARGRRLARIDVPDAGPIDPAMRRRQAPPAPDPLQTTNVGAEQLDEPGAPEIENLVFPGELLTTSTTLAVLLPGDDKESYFGARHVAIVQPDETDADVIMRGIEVCGLSVDNNIAGTIERYSAPAQPQQ